MDCVLVAVERSVLLDRGIVLWSVVALEDGVVVAFEFDCTAAPESVVDEVLVALLFIEPEFDELLFGDVALGWAAF